MLKTNGTFLINKHRSKDVLIARRFVRVSCHPYIRLQSKLLLRNSKTNSTS